VRRKWVTATLVGFLLVLVIAGIAGGKNGKGGSSPTHATTDLPGTVTSSATAPRSARPRSKPKATPKPTPKPARPRLMPAAHAATRAGLAVSYARNDVVQSQPAAGACHARGSGVLSEPDRHCTPGALNPAVTQANIGQTICVSGWTARVRPPESVTEAEKLASMAAYDDTGSAHDYEYDHFVPLELGGATNDARNLWPEPGASPNPKDSVEDELHRAVCDGQMSLARAQHIIVTDWVGWAHAHLATATTTTRPARTPVQAPAPVAMPAPHSSPTPPASVSRVHPGAFCSPEGVRGLTSRGTPMTCKTSTRDSRDRWRHS
jgi:hypothetical protein